MHACVHGEGGRHGRPISQVRDKARVPEMQRDRIPILLIRRRIASTNVVGVPQGAPTTIFIRKRFGRVCR